MRFLLVPATALTLSMWIGAPAVVSAGAGDGSACGEAVASQPVIVAKGGNAGGSGSASYRGYRNSSPSRGQGGYQSSGQGGYQGVPSSRPDDQPIPNATRNLPTSPPSTPPMTPPSSPTGN